VTISVLLADDQHLVRAGFRSLLRRDRDIAVVGEVSTGDEAVRAARQAKPDVVLMDIRMPGLDGIAATRQIVADPDLRDCRVIILTTFETDEYVFAALAAGASGFLTKEVDPDGLRQAVRVVAAGDALLSPSVTRRVVTQFAHRPPAAPGEGGDRLAALTAREREVLALMAEGRSNAGIGQALWVTEGTVEKHVRSILMKLQLPETAEVHRRVLAVLAFLEAD
jgi:DNA-binding NarL/FixJ family response regulator